MLLITRRENEAIVVNGTITVKVLEVRGGRVKLGFEFPPGSTVFREELFTKIQAENRAAALPAGEQPLASVLQGLQHKLPAADQPTPNNDKDAAHAHPHPSGDDPDEPTR
jgi:carbon storage regulator